MKAIANIYKSRKLAIPFIIAACRRLPLFRHYHDQRTYRRYLADGINLSAILRCSPGSVSSDDLNSLAAHIDLARRLLGELKNSVNPASPEGSNQLTKIIWMYWDKGLEEAPEVVKLAYRSWVTLNPDYEVRLLDNNSITAIADFEAVFKIASLDMGLAHKTDFIRTYLLARYGGIWVDSTSFCWQPLDEWINQATEETGFFVFRQPSSRADRQIANWFIAAAKGNRLIVELFNALCDYVFRERCTALEMRKYKYYSHYKEVSREGSGYALLNRMEHEGGYPYHFYHYIFNEIVKRQELSACWTKLLKTRNEFVGSNGPIDAVLVSKQSYKGKYPSSETYQRRAELLQKRLARACSDRND